jgi:hypothetical protein
MLLALSAESEIMESRSISKAAEGDLQLSQGLQENILQSLLAN